MADTRSKTQKLQDMAAQTDSPQEAAIARDKLQAMGIDPSAPKPPPQSSGAYSCPQCGLSFDSATSLTSHAIMVHIDLFARNSEGNYSYSHRSETRRPESSPPFARVFHTSKGKGSWPWESDPADMSARSTHWAAWDPLERTLYEKPKGWRTDTLAYHSQTPEYFDDRHIVELAKLERERMKRSVGDKLTDAIFHGWFPYEVRTWEFNDRDGYLFGAEDRRMLQRILTGARPGGRYWVASILVAALPLNKVLHQKYPQDDLERQAWPAWDLNRKDDK